MQKFRTNVKIVKLVVFVGRFPLLLCSYLQAGRFSWPETQLLQVR